MISTYDYWSANIIADSNIDCILVGDSAAMVMHGHKTTVFATIAMLLPHIQAVAKGAPNKFIIGDMPFCSYRKGLEHSMEAVDQMMKAGSHAIKLEGADDNIPLIQHMIRSGVPVMGHLGLTPQSVNTLGGFKVQGKSEESAQAIFEQALALQDAGCFALVLECVPYRLAQQITEALTIPTIGIGAGPYTSGQVLVFQDLLGLSAGRKPKFLKTYVQGFDLVKNALNQFDEETKQLEFPLLEEHCY
jgi:3-methyl-2-oxobutanoate hydroxymethyltransferase